MEKFTRLRTRLREKLNRRELVVAPGAYDALTARVFEKAGYEAVYMTGHGTGAGMLAWTDVGLTTMTEMVWNLKNICNAVNVPVIADMDTGYGNVVNVIRAVREYEQAGVSAFHIEDQAAPKKCGFMKGKALISREEMMGKIRAAAFAREDPNLLIIARCDARALEGPDGLYERAKAYLEAGADLIFPEAPRTAKDIKQDAKSINGPLFLMGSQLGKSYGLTFKEIAELGYSIVILPALAFIIAPKAVYDAAVEIKKADIAPDFYAQGRVFPWEELQELIRLPEVREYEERFLPKEEKTARWKGGKIPTDYFVSEPGSRSSEK